MENTQHEEQGRTRDERAAVCRAIAEQFALPEAGFAGDVSLAADWPGEVPEGAVVLVRTGKALPAGGPEEVAQSWMQVNDRLEAAGVGLYCEIKSPMLMAFYRFY